MSVRKQISFLLLLGFNILLGHNLFPHHHHAEILPGALNTDCPIEHEDHDSDDHPFHCHAFNNVTVIKDSQSNIQQKVKGISTLMVPQRQCVIEPPAASEFYRYTCLSIPDKSFKYYGAISLRAPPVSA